MSNTGIAAASWPEDRAVVRDLFREYVDSLNIDLTFQDVQAELADLPGRYRAPQGTILIARDDTGRAVGCIALRPLAEAGTCEMKRLYVQPAARGGQLGRRLAEAVIAFARAANYKRMYLDTLGPMTAAKALYGSLGFRATPPYYDNPLPDAQYLVLQL